MHRVSAGEILMLRLRGIEGTALDLRCDRLSVCAAGAKLLKEYAGGSPLRRALGKDRRTIARTHIRPLAVHLRRIVRNGDEYLQELSVADLRRIICDAHSLGVAGRFGTDAPIIRVAG